MVLKFCDDPIFSLDFVHFWTQQSSSINDVPVQKGTESILFNYQNRSVQYCNTITMIEDRTISPLWLTTDFSFSMFNFGNHMLNNLFSRSSDTGIVFKQTFELI